MTTAQIIDIVIAAVCVIGYAVMLYFKVRGNVVEAVSELIAAAEATGLCGSDKMARVVAELANLVPAPFKAILSEKILQRIAQHIFDWMRQYALNYIESKKQTDAENAQKELYERNAETTAAVLTELVAMSTEALVEKAEACELTITGNESKDELIRMIVLAILKKA